MKKMFLFFVSIVVMSIFMTGCVSSGYKDFYKPYNQDAISQMKNDPKIEFLKDGEEPKVFTTNDVLKDILLLRSKKYVPIGYSSFNGGFEDENAVKTQAKRIGAVVAIYGWKYTNTQQNSGVLMLPKTNYSTTNMYGSYGGNMFSGTAYTQSSGTQMVPYSNTQRRYDQEAVYFVKSNYDYPFGTQGTTVITREERIDIGSNGVKVNCIIENSPVYNSDLMVGDIIISINNQMINSYENYGQLSDECVKSKGTCILKVIRNKEEKEIKVQF